MFSPPFFLIMSLFLLSKPSRLLFRPSFTHLHLLHHRSSISLARTISTSSSSADVPAANPNSEFLNNLPAILEKARVDGGIPGMSVAIMHKGQLVFAQGFGKRNLKDPFTKEVHN